MPPNYPNQGQNPAQGQNKAQYPNQYPNSTPSQTPNSHELAPNEFAKHSMPKFGKIFAIILFTTAGVILLSFGIVYLMKYLNEKNCKNSRKLLQHPLSLPLSISNQLLINGYLLRLIRKIIVF